MKRITPKLLSLFVAFALALGLVGQIIQPAKALSSDLVISQVYGGAGCGTAGCSTYKNDYVVVFNRGSSSINLAGYSVQYASGTGNFNAVIASLSGTLASGQSYLVAGASGANGVLSIPAADVTGTTAMSATVGKIALVLGTTALSCGANATPCGAPAVAQIIDLVGYGTTANWYEGASYAPAPSTTTADFRASLGCTETDNNNLDFSTATPNPLNSSSPTTPCAVPDAAPTVSSTTPADTSTGVAINSDVTVTFSEAVNVTGTWATLSCTSSGSHTFAQSGSSPTFTLNPGTDFANSETCTITVVAAQVSDQDTNDPPDNMASDFTSTFTTVALVDAAPSVSSTTPVDGAIDIAINSNVTVTFSEPVAVASGGINISCANSGAHLVGVTGGPTTFTVNPTVDFGYSELCTVTVDHTLVTDSDTNDPPDTMVADSTFTFTTVSDPCLAAYTPIHTIQGSGTASPSNNTVVTTQGVVTGYLSTFGGFYIQDQAANYDADPLTSEGVYIYSTAYPVAVGDYVRVTGKVTEYQTVTEIGTITNVTKCQSVTPLTPTLLTLPLPSGATFEPYEGMYVQFENPFVVAQNYFLGRYGQMHISTRRFFNPTNGQGDTIDEFLRGSIVLDDGKSSQNPSPTPYIGLDNTVRAGDTLSAGLTGYMDQGSINSTAGIYGYRLQPVPASVQISRTNPRPAAPTITGSTLKVVGFNVENYFVTIDASPYPAGSPYYYISSSNNNTPRGADSSIEFARQRNKLFAGLVALNPDVFGVTELEAWTGAAAPADFVAGLNAAGASGTYAFIPDPTTGYGSDAIKNGLFYKVGSVTPVGPSISSTDPIYKRAPIAQTFVDNNGATFSVIVNHFKSKGSCPTDASDPEAEHGQGCWTVTRVAEATALLAFIEQVKTTSGDPDVLVIGDLNSYGVEDPINTLTTGGLINEMSFVPGADRYSYIFDGYSGYLDHALSSISMHFQVVSVQPWHINSDEPSIIDYNTEFKSTGTYPPDLYSANAYRASDHDPIMIGLNLDGVAPSALVTDPANGTILVNVKISELTAMFSEDVIHDGSQYAADNPNNYILVEQGANNTFDTLSCEFDVQTDDKEISIDSISYDPATYTAILSVNGGAYLREGDYRLFVCGTSSIRDLAGNILNNGEFDTLSDFGIRFPVDYVAATELPATGFAPDRVTELPAQTVSYAALGDLWLEIPSLNVKTSIVGVPQTGDTWDVTWLGSQAGWLAGSAYPTALGNSVLTAHVWDALNKPGAFYALDKLGYGDRVIVHSYGKTYTYEVRRVMTVSPTNVEAMLKHQDDAWLTLVTCKGYSSTTDEYNYRTLVRAVLVDVK